MKMDPVHLPLPGMPLVWRLPVGVALIRYECTLKGILKRCGGRCCSSPSFWPPRSGPNHTCVHLGDKGCTIGDDRPVTCHLYPLRIKDTTLFIHGATRWPAVCKGNRGADDAPPLIDSIREGLVAIFGQAEYDAARAEVMAGRDAYLRVPPWVPPALDLEDEQEAANTPPPAVDALRRAYEADPDGFVRERLGRWAPQDRPHEFDEDVNDGSMCTCGVPAAQHTLVEGPA